MRKPISLELAAYRSGLACSLYETIMEKASNECSEHLIDLICLDCDINHEVHQSLSAAMEVTHG
ncbi:hypothetical protein A6J66_017325 [Yersinia enterocolitica]|nr:hypothetical protein A6J66_017325 [Yersinia enterocolitica]